MRVADIHVVGLGASTPVGRNALSSAAAVRAGVSGFGQHPFMTDTAGEPMRVAMAPWLTVNLAGVERFSALLIPAIKEAMSVLTDNVKRKPKVALALGLPSARPGLPNDLEIGLSSSINWHFGGAFSAVSMFPRGHAAGILALEAACNHLEQSCSDVCVVAGVETYMEPETLEWLEDNDQLHSAGPLNNAWGFIPGEGAGAILLTRGEMVQSNQVCSLGQVLSVGTGVELNIMKTETICIGEGLTTAFLQGLAGLGGNQKVTDVYCDMNGEPYRADEFGFACLRTKEAFQSASDFVAPADCWGDVSSATASLCIALASLASRKQYSNGLDAFVWTSSELGERAAALLKFPSWKNQIASYD